MIKSTWVAIAYVVIILILGIALMVAIIPVEAPPIFVFGAFCIISLVILFGLVCIALMYGVIQDFK